MIQRKRRDFKKGVRGLAPPIVLSGQPSALLALLKAGNCRNPYLDTVGNGSALGKPGIYDPQLDPKALLPTHTFPPCWNLRKSSKRPALPGAVIPGRCRSLAPTLSPAVFSHLSPLLGFEEYVTVVGWTSRWLAGQFFPSASYPRSSLGMSHRFISFTTGSRWPNRARLGPRWCCFPTRLPKPHTGLHRAEFLFLLQKRVYPSP